MVQYYNGTPNDDFKRATKTNRTWPRPDYWEPWIMAGDSGNGELRETVVFSTGDR